MLLCIMRMATLDTCKNTTLLQPSDAEGNKNVVKEISEVANTEN